MAESMQDTVTSLQKSIYSDINNIMVHCCNFNSVYEQYYLKANFKDMTILREKMKDKINRGLRCDK